MPLPAHGTAGAPAAGIAAAALWGVGGLLLTALARGDVSRLCTKLRRPLRRTTGAPQIQPPWEENPLTVSTPFYLSSLLVQAGEFVDAGIPTSSACFILHQKKRSGKDVDITSVDDNLCCCRVAHGF